LPIQFLAYLAIGGTAGVVNLVVFLSLLRFGFSLAVSTAISFAVAAAANYFLCLALLFRHRERWSTSVEILMYVVVVAAAGFLDLETTRAFYALGAVPWLAKSLSSIFGLIYNFLGRRLFVFAKPVKTGGSGGAFSTVTFDKNP
jgi:putative flippase GtrA